MATTVTFPNANDNLFGTHWSVLEGEQYYCNVDVREQWWEAWSVNLSLIPTEITWSVAPTLPVATFKAFYGDVLQPWDRQFQVVTPGEITNLIGQFVRIDCKTSTPADPNADLDRKWYGVIAEAHNDVGGINPQTGRDYGSITVVAYGLEKLLADHVLLNSYFQSAIDGNSYETPNPIDFNRAGPRGVLGNRSAVKIGTSYEFAPKASTAETWSSKDILEYLVRFQTPLDSIGIKVVDFQLDLPPGIPTDTDSPILKTENATTYSLISQILDRRRGLMWWIEVETLAGDVEFVKVKADSINKVAVTGDKLEVPANANQINLRYELDPLTNVVINNSNLPKVDQVIVQGPRVRCVGSFNETNSNIEAAWSSANETTYEAGGTPHPGSTPKKRKQTRNDAARRSPTLEDVYSLFQIPEDWDQKVLTNPLFLKENDTDLRQQNTPELFIEQTLPLLTGVDYSGTKIEAGGVPTSSGTNEEMRPFVLFAKPWTSSPTRYQNAEGSVAGVEITHSKENPRLACHVSIPQHSRSVRIKVNGQPQHAIAYSDFTPISGEDPAVGEFDWKDAIFTLSLLAQYRTEGRYPTDANLPFQSVIRRKVIYGGDQYFRDYVAPGTVVGLDEDGELVTTTTGGYIPAKGGADDPETMLADIAKVSAAWYCATHYVLTLESYRLKAKSDIPLGSLVVQAGGDPDQVGKTQEVNAPITQITFHYPMDEKPARMKIKTWAGELDAVEFVATKPPELRKRAKA